VRTRISLRNISSIDPKAIKALADLARDAVRDRRFGSARTCRRFWASVTDGDMGQRGTAFLPAFGLLLG